MLESRCLPSIFFGGTGGAPDGLVQGPGIIPHVDLELIYWGTPDRWAGASASPEAITAAVTSIYRGSYFDGLAQYGIGKGSDIRVDNITDSNAPDGFTDAQVTQEILSLMSAGRATEAEADFNRLYFVITPPGSTTAPATEQHDMDFFIDGFELFEDGNDDFHYAWIANDGNLDHVTRDFSRTLVNAVTNTNNGPNGFTGLLFNPNGNPSGAFELAGDPAADNFTYRLDGVLVQAYWSHNDTAWVVPTGAGEAFNFFVTGTGGLTVLGYSGPPMANSTTLSTDPQGGVQVVMDVPSFDSGDLHATAQFEPGAISGVTVLPSQGDTSVNVESTVAGAPVTISLGSTGIDVVNISPTAHLLDTIQADVTIHGPQNEDGTTNITQALLATLNVHDDSNVRADVYTSTGFDLSRTSTSGAPLGGALHYGGIGNVFITGGSGTYNVQDTEDSFTNTLFTTTLAAADNATVNIGQTTGPLNLNLGAGVNTVLLGSTSHRLAGFLAPLVLNAAFNSTILTVDDSFDQRSQPNAVISESAITGLVPAGITYSSTELRSLTVLSGSGGTTFTVSNTPGTPSLAVTTTIRSGAGADGIFVQGTTGELDITGQAGGVQTVTIGNAGSLQGIQGKVALFNTLGATDLIVNDLADTSTRTVNVNPRELSGLSAPIDYDGNLLHSLTIEGGTAPVLFPDTFTVSPLPEAPVTINGGLFGPIGHTFLANNILSVAVAGMGLNPHLVTTGPTSGQWTFTRAGPVNFQNMGILQHDGVNSVVDGVFVRYDNNTIYEHSRAGFQRIDVNAVAVSTGVDAFGDQAAFILYDNAKLYEWSPNTGFKLVDVNVAQASSSQQAADTVFIRYRDGQVFEHTGTSPIAGFTPTLVHNAVSISAGVDANFNPAVFIITPLGNTQVLREWSIPLALSGVIDTNVVSISAESRADPDGGLTFDFRDTVFIVYNTGQLFEHTDAGFRAIAVNVVAVSAGAANVGTVDNPSLRPASFILYNNAAVYEWGGLGASLFHQLDSNDSQVTASEEPDAAFVLRADSAYFEYQDGALTQIDTNAVGI
jgi:hypothetical protein